MSKHQIWVCTYGGVIGFEPCEIAEFETEFEKLKPHLDTEDIDEAKWNFFNFYFEDELGFRTAWAYSALWNDGEAWEQFDEIMANKRAG